MAVAQIAPRVFPASLAREAGYTPRAVETASALETRSAWRAEQTAARLTDRDDTALVAALIDGDADALDTLYQRHSRSVFSLAAHLLGDRGSAEEVVQETFVKLWRRPDAYQPQRGRLLPWLLGVAHHHAIDLLRRRQLELRHRATSVGPDGSHQDGLESLGLVADDPDPGAHVGWLEQQRTVASALSLLPSAQRVPLEMAYYRGLTQVEIAAELHEPLGTVKTRMRMALQWLRTAPGIAELWSDRG
ncbi:MAG: sigma-70 family RNA polymerase sigma factor [Chloroflexi bacterium]|nr:sigma-70 family RNA polymerase sigma factor [Chloroflexota bacterium]